MAPELLRGQSNNTPSSDVYSFGITLYEVFSRQEPYEGDDKAGLLEKIADPEIKKRPPVPDACPEPVAAMMIDCLVADPALRPTFDELDMRMKRLDTEKLKSVEAMKSFRHRSRAARNENLMYKVFPRHIADALRDGRQVRSIRRNESQIVIYSLYFSIGRTRETGKRHDLLQ
jgi:guanylate cyclase, other